MQEVPVLMVTQDPALWQRWQALAPLGWRPLRGVSLMDMRPWQEAGRQLVILDLALPQLPVLSDAAWVRHFKGLRVLALSAHASDDEGRQLLAHGASGYAHTHLPVESLSRILMSIEEGSIWMGRSLLQKLLQDIDQRLPPVWLNDWSVGLSDREAEVAKHAALGQSNAQIAQQLQITERTIRAHLSAVFEKLHVQDRLQLALKVHGIRA